MIRQKITTTIVIPAASSAFVLPEGSPGWKWPQWGQARALAETEFPQEGHSIKPMSASNQAIRHLRGHRRRNP
jgi:hypothetical protein